MFPKNLNCNVCQLSSLLCEFIHVKIQNFSWVYRKEYFQAMPISVKPCTEWRNPFSIFIFFSTLCLIMVSNKVLRQISDSARNISVFYVTHVTLSQSVTTCHTLSHTCRGPESGEQQILSGDSSDGSPWSLVWPTLCRSLPRPCIQLCTVLCNAVMHSTAQESTF